MLPLTIISARAVFAEVVLFQEMGGDGEHGRIQLKAAVGHVRAHFEGDTVIHGIHGAFAKGERCVM